MFKKYGALICVLGVLAVAVFINARFNEDLDILPKPSPTLEISLADEEAVSAVRADYFEAFRAGREGQRNMELEYLDAIILEERTDQETLADAQQQKLGIVDGMEKEFTIEALLKAKGFADAAVTVHKGSVNVILRADALSDQQAAQVFDIVTRETGESAKNIKVSTAKE